MTQLTIRGERYVTLATVAECYACETRWVERVYSEGLLGRGVVQEGTVVIHVRMLERVADIVRLHVYQGVSLELVAAFLDTPEDLLSDD